MEVAWLLGPLLCLYILSWTLGKSKQIEPRLLCLPHHAWYVKARIELIPRGLFWGYCHTSIENHWREGHVEILRVVEQVEPVTIWRDPWGETRCLFGRLLPWSNQDLTAKFAQGRLCRFTILLLFALDRTLF